MKLPNHLAIIMDGNGRWAQLRGQPRVFGHIKGTRIAKKIITECSRLGVKNLTLYAFSAENWLRPEAEVSFLMKLLRRYLDKESQNLVKENIRFSIIGEVERLPKDVIDSIQKTMRATQECTGLNLIFAISYGSRQEITRAVSAIAQKVRDGDMSPEQINESVINEHLGTGRPPGFLADGYLIVQMNLARFQGLVDDIGGHQLGDTGRFHPLVTLQIRQKVATLVIHQDITTHRHLRGGWNRFGVCSDPAQRQQGQREQR